MKNSNNLVILVPTDGRRPAARHQLACGTTCASAARPMAVHHGHPAVRRRRVGGGPPVAERPRLDRDRQRVRGRGGGSGRASRPRPSRRTRSACRRCWSGWRAPWPCPRPRCSCRRRPPAASPTRTMLVAVTERVIARGRGARPRGARGPRGAAAPRRRPRSSEALHVYVTRRATSASRTVDAAARRPRGGGGAHRGRHRRRPRPLRAAPLPRRRRDDAANYHLVVNTALLGYDGAADLVVRGASPAGAGASAGAAPRARGATAGATRARRRGRRSRPRSGCRSARPPAPPGTTPSGAIPVKTKV